MVLHVKFFFSICWPLSLPKYYPFSHDCLSNETTANITFQINIRSLFSSLSSNAAANNVFYNSTLTSDTVYGHFMCRGDVPFQLCGQCVINATQKLSSDLQCSLSKGVHGRVLGLKVRGRSSSEVVGGSLKGEGCSSTSAALRTGLPAVRCRRIYYRWGQGKRHSEVDE
ncbi:hypothetical protein GYH30_015174 [Glycine max]|uniref:Gnk2-homologous domain-containing protein n=1 Tax=Glycine max TaxID=3847 RepID=K7KV67_SOYBN|nr:hypothetical protein GYH30_015174 [Glycine max]